MNSNRIQLFIPLTPAECASRLTAAMGAERAGFFPLARHFGSSPVIGRVTQSSLWIRKRISYRNPFQNYLLATMKAETGGTVISGKITTHPATRAFMFLWFGGVVLGGGLMLITSISSILASSSRIQDEWRDIVMLAAMLAFGFGFVRFGRYLARDEARFLKEFLRQALINNA